jgi:integrase/recombinase XerD
MPVRGATRPVVFPGDTGPGGWREAVDDHLTAMAVAGLSATTIYGRRKTLAGFVTWMIDRGITTPGVVTIEVLESFQRHLWRHRKANGDPLSFRSQQQHLIAVRQLFKWLARQRRIPVNPAAELDLPKGPIHLPRSYLSAEEAEQVLAQPDLETVLGVRDRVILEVLYSTGIRRSELHRLSVFDINLNRSTLLVREGKGGIDRVVPLGQRATAWLAKYLADIRPALCNNMAEAALFLSAQGTPICLAWFTAVVHDYIQAAEVGKGGSCHLFRHTTATLMLEGGADVRWVQALLGHRSLVSTQVYTQVEITKLAEIHAATHPGASNLPRSQRPKPSGGLKVAITELTDSLKNRPDAGPTSGAPE